MQASSENFILMQKFEHKLNSLYTHPSLSSLLKNGEIDFALMGIFETLIENK
jgi:hypothetical protein